MATVQPTTKGRHPRDGLAPPRTAPPRDGSAGSPVVLPHVALLAAAYLLGAGLAFRLAEWAVVTPV
jgi:hypothetical protein